MHSLLHLHFHLNTMRKLKITSNISKVNFLRLYKFFHEINSTECLGVNSHNMFFVYMNPEINNLNVFARQTKQTTFMSSPKLGCLPPKSQRANKCRHPVTGT